MVTSPLTSPLNLATYSPRTSTRHSSPTRYSNPHLATTTTIPRHTAPPLLALHLISTSRPHIPPTGTWSEPIAFTVGEAADSSAVVDPTAKEPEAPPDQDDKGPIQMAPPFVRVKYPPEMGVLTTPFADMQ